VGSKYEPPDLQQAFLYPGARSAAPGEAKPGPQATVTLPSGQTISGTVKALDDFSVTLCDAEGQYHSISLDKNTKIAVEDKNTFHRQMLDKYTDTQMHDLTAYLVTLK
jgi:hypothetical protein